MIQISKTYNYLHKQEMLQNFILKKIRQLDGKEFSDRVEPQLDRKILFRRVDKKVWILTYAGDKLSFHSF